MRYPVIGCCIIMILSNITGCGSAWKHQGGVVILPEVYPSYSQDAGLSPDVGVKAPSGREMTASRRVSFTLPDGWHWLTRGHDFMATKDGVFLQNIFIERIHIDQVEQSDWMFPMISFSSKQWPVRTVKNLKKPFLPGMSPAEAADVVLSSRASNPGIADLEIREVSLQDIAGNHGFKAVYDFRLNIQGRKTPYRTVCYGFMLDDWFYSVSYTAALRYYFQKDASAFESVVQSFRLVEK